MDTGDRGECPLRTNIMRTEKHGITARRGDSKLKSSNMLSSIYILYICIYIYIRFQLSFSEYRFRLLAMGQEWL